MVFFVGFGGVELLPIENALQRLTVRLGVALIVYKASEFFYRCVRSITALDTMVAERRKGNIREMMAQKIRYGEKMCNEKVPPRAQSQT